MRSPLGLSFDGRTEGIPSIYPSSGGVRTYKVVDNKSVVSLFGSVDGPNSSAGQFRPFARGLDANGDAVKTPTFQETHEDDNYAISIKDIVEYCKQYPAMKLDYSDFAYLKDVGVYPNNRLIIARRFQGPVKNDLTSIESTPMSTLISYIKDENFIDVTFGEKWEEAEATFENVLNDLSKDIFGNKGLGPALGGQYWVQAMGLIPIRGFMDGLQYAIFNKLEISDATYNQLPLANPNLIRQAQQRSTIGKNNAGSGLTGKFTVKMVVEYEQKFINGVDPTLVYLDIIQNALTFGTSDPVFQFNTNFNNKAKGFIDKLSTGNLAEIADAIKQFVEAIVNVVSTLAQDLVDKLTRSWTDVTVENVGSANLSTQVINAFQKLISSVISKYRIKLIGITQALTGAPSTPWHVTIGNPKRPIFSSGDMLCTSVSLNLGKNLAFNDLPSYVKIEFSLTSARELGANEIFSRFNCGGGRSYRRGLYSFVDGSVKVDDVFSGGNSGLTQEQINDNQLYAAFKEIFDKSGKTTKSELTAYMNAIPKPFRTQRESVITDQKLNEFIDAYISKSNKYIAPEVKYKVTNEEYGGPSTKDPNKSMQKVEYSNNNPNWLTYGNSATTPVYGDLTTPSTPNNASDVPVSDVQPGLSEQFAVTPPNTPQGEQGAQDAQISELRDKAGGLDPRDPQYRELDKTIKDFKKEQKFNSDLNRNGNIDASRFRPFDPLS